jgi:hypothetical protein
MDFQYRSYVREKKGSCLPHVGNNAFNKTPYSMPKPDEVASFEEPNSDRRTNAPQLGYPRN